MCGQHQQGHQFFKPQSSKNIQKLESSRKYWKKTGKCLNLLTAGVFVTQCRRPLDCGKTFLIYLFVLTEDDINKKSHLRMTHSTTLTVTADVGCCAVYRRTSTHRGTFDLSPALGGLIISISSLLLSTEEET